MKMYEKILEDAVEHYKKYYLPETDLTFALLVAVLQGLLMDVRDCDEGGN